MSFRTAVLVLAWFGASAPALPQAVDYGAYGKRLSQARSDAAKVAILKELQASLPEDSPIYSYVQEASAAGPVGSATIESAVKMVALRASIGKGTEPATDVKASAAAITSSPSYRDIGTKRESNWIDRALDRLRLKRRESPTNLPRPDAESVSYAIDVFVALVWVALALGIGALLFFAFRQFSWRRSSKRKALALLDEAEPVRSADEWLAQADALSSAGDHRGAVRCLYLACLLRLDENGIARFDRSQTNWEHFGRIRSSPKLPEGLDFGEPTRAFDRIWYGGIVRGDDDVEHFRAFYLRLMSRLEGSS